MIKRRRSSDGPKSATSAGGSLLQYQRFGGPGVPARHVMLSWAPCERCSGRSPGTDVGASLRLRTSPRSADVVDTRLGRGRSLCLSRLGLCHADGTQLVRNLVGNSTLQEGMGSPLPDRQHDRGVSPPKCAPGPRQGWQTVQHAPCTCDLHLKSCRFRRDQRKEPSSPTPMRAAAMRAAMRAAACHNKPRERRCPAPARLARLSAW